MVIYLVSHSSIYGSFGKNTTTFYDKKGKILNVYRESVEEVKKRLANQIKSSMKQRREIEENLRYEVFNQKLSKSFKYNKDGKVIEEYNKLKDYNLSYIYDKYGNLIKKVKDNGEIVFTQSFKICEE